jgi:hypothetical protein
MLLILILGAACAGAREYMLFADFTFGKSMISTEIPDAAEYFPNQLEDDSPSAVAADMKIGMEVFRNLGFFFGYGGWLREFEFESVPRFGSGASLQMRHIGGGIRFLLPASENWSFMANLGAARYYGEVDRIMSDPPDPGTLGSESGEWDFSNNGFSLAGGFVYRGTRDRGTLLAGLETGFHAVKIELQDDETGETSSPQTTIVPEIKAYIGFGFQL